MASPAEGHTALIEDYFRRIESLVVSAGMAHAYPLQ